MEPGSNRDMPDLINFIKTNGYELEDVKYNQRSGDSARVTFSKMTHISDNGNDINDAMITISIKFDRRFDYKNIAWMEEDHEQEEILDKTGDFIQKLIDGNYEDRCVGVSKGKNKRKTRKNRK